MYIEEHYKKYRVLEFRGLKGGRDIIKKIKIRARNRKVKDLLNN